MDESEFGQDAAATSQDQRSAARCALMIRGAKLICNDCEYLCIIRDVSETGLRLRLFHDIPTEERMALELANGEVYFIERVWARDGEAGFRLSAPIDVHAFISEPSPYPRRPMRLRIQLDAVITAGGQASFARILDISQHGARIEAARPLAIGQKLELDAEGLPLLAADVRWRLGVEHGLVFRQVFAFDDLARLVARLQARNGASGRKVASGFGPAMRRH